MASKKAKRKQTGRAGYEKLPGSARRYRVLKTDEIISERQYIKRTQGKTKEAIARKNFAKRLAHGLPDPRRRYKKVVEQWRLSKGPNAKIKGTSNEALEFKAAWNTLRMKQTASIHTKKGIQQRKNHLKALLTLNIISKSEYERYRDELDD